MMFYIENDFLKVRVSDKGAEMQSIVVKKSGREALWQANVEGYWGRQAPILFPNCGCLPNGMFTHKGKEYKCPQHGFLRDQMFKKIAEQADSVTLSSKSNADTLEIYPFAYEVQIKFWLSANTINHTVTVFNQSGEEMYFNVGYHPAFACPFDTSNTASDYTLQFEKVESPTELIYDFESGFNTGEKRLVFEKQDRLPITEALFDDDSIAMDNLESDYVKIVENNTGRSVKIGIKGFPFTVFWSCLAKPMRFLCVEPWDGINAMAGAKSDLSEKFMVQKLADGKQYQVNLEITFEE